MTDIRADALEWADRADRWGYQSLADTLRALLADPPLSEDDRTVLDAVRAAERLGSGVWPLGARWHVVKRLRWARRTIEFDTYCGRTFTQSNRKATGACSRCLSAVDKIEEAA